MLYLVLIVVFFMIDECHNTSNGVNYTQRSSDVYLKCINITDTRPRSIIECALLSSQIEHYENRFAYRNGNCHACRADNENCVEYQLAGPHFIEC